MEDEEIIKENEKNYEDLSGAITCHCGCDTFNLEQHNHDTIFMGRSEMPKDCEKTICISRISHTLICTECGNKSEEFVTTLLGWTEPSKKDHIDRYQKKCYLCGGDTFNAEVKAITKGFFEKTVFEHILTCTNPECPWTLKSTATSIHKG